jgi:hypothetical protein
MVNKKDELVAVAAQVYGPIATAQTAHARAGASKELAIQTCVDDALTVAQKLIDGAAARVRLREQMARTNGGPSGDDVLEGERP